MPQELLLKRWIETLRWKSFQKQVRVIDRGHGANELPTHSSPHQERSRIRLLLRRLTYGGATPPRRHRYLPVVEVLQRLRVSNPSRRLPDRSYSVRPARDQSTDFASARAVPTPRSQRWPMALALSIKLSTSPTARPNPDPTAMICRARDGGCLALDDCGFRLLPCTCCQDEARSGPAFLRLR